MLEVRNLTVTYGETRVLENYSLTVDTGEIVAVTGPSGAGKSTLLNCICGFVRMDSGVVLLDGRDITSCAPHTRGIVLMSQSGDLFPTMNVAANVAYGLARRGVARDQAALRVRALLDMVGLAGFEHRDIASLSGGQARRVALARALAPEPSVLLLDEPLVGLDQDAHDSLMDELSALLRAARTTVVMVTHDLAEARSVADRIAHLPQ